tara:strand:+ start:292 stop:813 length:522 start_codon:yes stop_codon:yes gene_type:complete
MKKLSLLTIALVFLSLISACKREIDPTTGKPKVYESNNRERIRKAADKNTSSIFGGQGGGGNTNYEFSTSNVLWRASLEVLNFIPLQSVSYSGGLIVTDWYEKKNESIKIEVSFKTSEVTSSAVEVKSFKRTCDASRNCSTVANSPDFNESIKSKILSKAREFSLQDLKKKKK